MNNTKPSLPVRLHVNGLGHVPSFKNSKMLTRGRLITDPKKQKWMNACIDSFESQLMSLCQTREGGTSTDALQRFLTASLPQDDAWLFVPELQVNAVLVEPGDEGAIITIDEPLLTA